MKQPTENPNVTELRERLGGYFLEEAEKSRVQLNPVVRPVRDLILARYLYEEANDDRLFIVSYHDMAVLDAFTKRTGLNYEVKLLHMHINDSDTHFPVVWEAYRKWIHEKTPENEVLVLLGL